jgi:hypothetical protein
MEKLNIRERVGLAQCHTAVVSEPGLRPVLSLLHVTEKRERAQGALGM